MLLFEKFTLNMYFFLDLLNQYLFCYKQNKLLLYADDSAILVSGKNIPTVENALSEDLISVSHWLVDNKLSSPG